MGFMTPPPPAPAGLVQDDYSQMSPLQQSQFPYDAEVTAEAPPPSPMQYGGDIGGSNSMQPPPFSEQMKQAGAQPLGIDKHIQNELEGVASHMKPSEDGSQNKWLQSMAPILAGAAAVFGGVSHNPVTQQVLGGIAKGYTNHLMTQAQEAANLKHLSDTKTIELAHKYMAEMPGDVDATKYPELAEGLRKMREGLVNGKLSSPKDAQDFVLNYTHYKNDIAEQEEDVKAEAEKDKEKAKYDAFLESGKEAGIPKDVLISSWVHHNGGLAPDPKHPGQFVAPQTITGMAGIEKQGLANTAAAERNKNTVEAANTRSTNAIAAANARASNHETQANARAKGRQEGKNDPAKQFSSDLAKAEANARAVDRLRPVPSDQARQKDIYDSMFQRGHIMTAQDKQGNTVYYIGNGKFTHNQAEAQAALGGKASPQKMNPPPSPSPSPQTPFNDLGEEEDEDYGGE